MMLSRRSNVATKLARLSIGLLVALFVLSPVSAAQSSVLPAAQSGAGPKVQDRSHDNDNPDNTLYALYQTINAGTTSVPSTCGSGGICGGCPRGIRGGHDRRMIGDIVAHVK